MMFPTDVSATCADPSVTVFGPGFVQVTFIGM
jgi:hypothetical protein